MSRHLGLDLGGTNIKATVVEVDDNGEPRQTETATWPTEADGGPDVVTSRLIDAGASMIESVGSIESVGIGVPGLFDAGTGTIELFPNLPGPWKGHRLRDPIGEGLGAPARLINDARAFVIAEGTRWAQKTDAASSPCWPMPRT